MAAESLLEPQQRAALVRLHQEHEVCAERNVHKIYRQRQHKRHAAGQVSGLWADIPARCGHDGVAGQQNMHGKAVQMHKVGGRQANPGGKQKGGQRRRDANGI